MQKTKTPSRFPLLIFLLALLLRLGPVIAARELAIGLDDMFQYDMLARSLADGQGYRWYAEDDLALVQRYLPLEFEMDGYDPRGVLTSLRAPGYPFFLSLIYRLSGLENRFFAARLVQAFVGALVAPLTYYLARHLFPGREKAARWAGFALAVYPMLVIYPLALATEVIFIPLMLGMLVMLLKAGESRRWQDYLLAGLLMGAAALTRSVILGIVPFVLLWVWFVARDKRGALLVLISLLVFVVPWSVRNSRLHGQFSMVENSMGYNLYLGYYPGSEGRFEFGPSLDLMPILDDAAREQIGKEKALAFIREDPAQVPYLAMRKLGYFFGLERRALTYFYSNNFFGFIPQPLLIALFGLFVLPFVLLAGLTAFTVPALRWSKAQVLAAAVFLGYLAPHVLVLAEPRFHLAVVPLLAAFASYGWVERRTVWSRLAAPGQGWRLVLAGVLLALLVFNWGFELWHDWDSLSALFGPDGNQTYFSY